MQQRASIEHSKIVFYHKMFNSIWPCLALQVMTKGHARDEQGAIPVTYDLAMPHCASNDWAHNHVLPKDVQLILAMPLLASKDCSKCNKNLCCRNIHGLTQLWPFQSSFGQFLEFCRPFLCFSKTEQKFCKQNQKKKF